MATRVEESTLMVMILATYRKISSMILLIGLKIASSIRRRSCFTGDNVSSSRSNYSSRKKDGESSSVHLVRVKTVGKDCDLKDGLVVLLKRTSGPIRLIATEFKKSKMKERRSSVTLFGFPLLYADKPKVRLNSGFSHARAVLRGHSTIKTCP